MRFTVVSDQNDSLVTGTECAELLQSRPRVINSVSEGDEEMIPTRLHYLDRVGSSSGRDALAGAYVVLRACPIRYAGPLYKCPLGSN